MKSYGHFEQLDEKTHDRNSFDYGIAELNDFLLMFASLHQKRVIFECLGLSLLLIFFWKCAEPATFKYFLQIRSFQTSNSFLD